MSPEFCQRELLDCLFFCRDVVRGYILHPWSSSPHVLVDPTQNLCSAECILPLIRAQLSALCTALFIQCYTLLIAGERHHFV